MVTGRSGDTLKLAVSQPAPGIPGATASGSQKPETATSPTASATNYRLQSADGIIANLQRPHAFVNICIGLIGIMALFMGLLNIAERAGGIRFLSRIIGPFFSRLFPDIPKGHPAMGHMVMNFSANLLGLDNAATPFALKAMDSLQEINPDKSTASDPQIMFLCLHGNPGLPLVIPVSITRPAGPRRMRPDPDGSSLYPSTHCYLRYYRWLRCASSRSGRRSVSLQARNPALGRAVAFPSSSPELVLYIRTAERGRIAKLFPRPRRRADPCSFSSW